MEFHLTAKKLGVVIFQYNYKEKQKPGVKKKKLKQIQDARDNLPKARCASLISGLQVMQYDREGTVHGLCVYARLLSRVRPFATPWTIYIQPARLLCPWNFQGKTTRAGCHFLL